MLSHQLSRMGLVATLVAALCAPAGAQTPRVDRGPVNSVSLEALRPSIDGGDFTALSSAWFVAAAVPVARRTRIVGEVPFAFGGVKGFESDAALGNPYLGVEFAGAPDIFFDFGIRLPLASDENLGSLIGLAADPINRLEVFLPDATTVVTALEYRPIYPSGAGFRLRLAPKFLIPTEGGDVEVLANYGAAGGYFGERATVTGGLAGLTVLSAEGGSFGERSLHRLELEGQLNLGRLRPGVVFHLPIDEDTRDLHDFTVGLTLTVAAL